MMPSGATKHHFHLYNLFLHPVHTLFLFSVHTLWSAKKHLHPVSCAQPVSCVLWLECASCWKRHASHSRLAGHNLVPITLGACCRNARKTCKILCTPCFAAFSGQPGITLFALHMCAAKRNCSDSIPVHKNASKKHLLLLLQPLCAQPASCAEPEGAVCTIWRITSCRLSPAY